MRKKIVLTALAAMFMLMLVLSGCSAPGEKPLADLKVEDIISADISLYPPDTTITVTDSDSLTELAGILNDVVLYKQDNAGREMDGQLVKAILTLKDGSTATVGAYGDYMYYNEVCYKAEYEPSERLNAFGNSLYRELPDKGTPPDGNDPNAEPIVGISRTSAAEAYQDDWGVKLTAKDITSTGLVLVCEQCDGAPSGELQTGSPYVLERLVDGQWTALDLLPTENDLAWTMEAWGIQPNDTTEWTVDWSGLYGELPAGNYRISKEIMDFRGSGDYDQRFYYAGFELFDIEPGEPMTVSYLYNGFYVALPYVAGWEYRIDEYADGCMSYGVSFRPEGEDGWVELHYWDSFGVCGTGLESEEYALDDGTIGSMGTYDGHAVWDFISFPANKGSFVAMTKDVGSWWPQYGEAAMEILGSAEYEMI